MNLYKGTFQMYRSVVILLLFYYTQTRDLKGCDYDQYVTSGKTYYITSPNYSSNYLPGVKCRWTATCPSGYNCRVDCNDVDIPQSTSCSIDRLLISKTGDPQLASADNYCGRGTISVVSSGQKISLGLLTTSNSTGGRFRCDLTAQTATSSPCTCGYRKQNRIVGGDETEPNEFPMMAGLVYVSEVTIKCGAVIISNDYVLTAGHCVKGKLLTELAVVVGEHNVTTGNDTSATEAFKVASYLVHPKYTQATYDYDIALVRVDRKIKFSYYVGPVCLPFKFVNWDFTGASVTMLGWGTLFPGGPVPKALRKVNVDVISQSTCKSNVSMLTERQMCTFTKGKDACQNDSGGPVMYADPLTGSLYLAGIISSGYFCASNHPAVNTRVTIFLDWIQQNAPFDYCKK